jgi:hypothetical protein
VPTPSDQSTPKEGKEISGGGLRADQRGGAARQSTRAGAAPQAWRPQSRAARTAHTRKMFVAVFVALVVSGLILFAFSRVAERAPSKVKIGSRVFDLGFVEQRVANIDKGGPLYFNDLVNDDGRPLPIVVNLIHHGNDPAKDEWVILNPIPVGSDIRCAVRWQASKSFLDPCTNDAYAPNGEGPHGKSLTRYTTRFLGKKNDRLVADLNKLYVAP